MGRVLRERTKRMPKRRRLDPARADRFGWEEGDLEFSQCLRSRHKTPGEEVCTAFPEGILEAIQTNNVDHWRPYPGDQGVLFEAEEC